MKAPKVIGPAELERMQCECSCGEPLTARPRKAKRPRSKGRGPFCVFSKNGKKVRCFTSRETAERVAKGFGASFRVGANDGDD